jgi:hypothetical protein
MKKIILLFLLSAAAMIAQNAQDYFPSTEGFKWYFKNTPYDSLNIPVDSLISYQIDTFATTITYDGKVSKVILSKYGLPEDILDSPYFDSSFVHTEGTNIWNFISGFDDVFGGIGFGVQGWYSVFRLSSAVGTNYTVFTKDTLVTIDSTALTLRIAVTGRRLTDQVITTPYGLFNCKKFLIRPQVSIIPQGLPIPIPIVTLYDTIYIAPGHYIVQSVRPSSNVDLSLFGFPAFYIPGGKTEAISPPPVLSVDRNFITVPSEGDTTFVLIMNNGEGTLSWSAEIQEGSEWISFYSSSSGSEDDTLFLSFQTNNNIVKRFGLIRISANGAFSSPKYISITQDEGVIVSVDDQENLPDDYYLGQNYPNPFNPVTTIPFRVKSGGMVNISLYDMLGNKIKTLAEDFYSPGNYSIRVNAEKITSGVYFYKININGFTQSRKMILMK